MTRGLTPEGEEKQLAGTCVHKWRSRKSPYFVAHICEFCKLYRYKANPRADWEYRAPIPFARSAGDFPA
ncbi:MAG: hypothetical protein DMG23_13085 [Acidobacteria bacterium]|nr:MAG: hypothetical protein DMG23_13085 [Acidobacteriota bacterium]